MEFADRLAEIRRQRGLSQAQLAERVGISASQLHRYENATAQPTLDVLRRLALALSVSADDLVFAETHHTDVADRLQAAYANTTHLTDHQQTVIAEVIEAFLAHAAATARPNRPRGPTQRRRRTT